MLLVKSVLNCALLQRLATFQANIGLAVLFFFSPNDDLKRLSKLSRGAYEVARLHTKLTYAQSSARVAPSSLYETLFSFIVRARRRDIKRQYEADDLAASRRAPNARTFSPLRLPDLCPLVNKARP